MSLTASQVTTSRMQQCFSVMCILEFTMCFLFLWHCCILSEIKLTTTTTSLNSLQVRFRFWPPLEFYYIAVKAHEHHGFSNHMFLDLTMLNNILRHYINATWTPRGIKTSGNSTVVPQLVFMQTSKIISKIHNVDPLWEEYHSRRASNSEIMSQSWRHHGSYRLLAWQGRQLAWPGRLKYGRNVLVWIKTYFD